eukprot:169546-Prorocentrum_minimum.AAC.1
MFLADADEVIAKVARMHAMVSAFRQTLPVSVDISHNVGLQIDCRLGDSVKESDTTCGGRLLLRLG